MSGYGYRKARKEIRRGRQKQHAVQGVLGNGAGTVKVGTSGYQCYARIGDRKAPIIVTNLNAPMQDGLPVVIGEDRYNPGLRQVLGVSYQSGVAYPENPAIGQHAPSHRDDGTDPVYLNTTQVLPLSVRPTGTGLNVQVYGGLLPYPSGAVWVVQKTIDMSAYLPATGAAWVLVQVDETGTISVVEGTPVDDTFALTYDLIPAAEMRNLALAAVRLKAGQTAFSMLFTNPDIRDLRFFGIPSGVAVEEQDGSPAVGWTNMIKLPNGTVTDDGAGVVTVDIPFTSLADAPGDYTDMAGFPVVVNSTEDGLEFADATSGAGVVMSVPVVLLDTTVAAGGVAYVEITAIPAIYNHIEIYAHGKTDAAAGRDYIKINLNGDATDANYYRRSQIDGAASNGADRILAAWAGSSATGASSSLHAVLSNIQNTTLRKTVLAESVYHSPAVSAEVWQSGVHWNNASGVNAITSIRLVPTTGNLAEGSRIVMLGYRKAYITPSGYFGDLLDAFALATHGGELVRVNSGATALEPVVEPLVMQKGVTLNESGADSDTRIEGDTEPDLFVVDAGEDAVYIGGRTNGVKIEKGGNIKLLGGATQWRDQLTDALNLKSQGAGLSLNADEGTVDFAYNAAYHAIFSSADAAFCNVQLNHDKQLTSSIYPHIHWFQAKNYIPNLLLAYRWQINGAAKTTAWTLLKCDTLAFTYVSGTIHQISYSAAIAPPVGSTLSDIVQFRLYRDTTNVSTLFTGNCPYNTGGNATVGMMAFDIHFAVDSLGSNAEYVK